MTPLFNYDIAYLSQKAQELGFVRDTLEKVMRLADILEYFNTNPILKNSLALKGGTAINLTIFNLPRLSVDMDFDYLITNSREEMIESRKVIRDAIDHHMAFGGYSKNSKSKNPHSLDSWVYDYISAGGNKDNIKIEINYSLRAHVLPAQDMPVCPQHLAGAYQVKTLNPLEIFGGKINALLNRAAARDLYDTTNMIRFGIFDASKREMLRKCVVFYAAISAKDKTDVNKTFNTQAIDAITQRKIKTDLRPVIKRKDDFELEPAKKLVKEYMVALMTLTKEEKEFLNKFEIGDYIPELLFEDKEILNRISHHPMAIWKTQ